jgi:hypothetical protein
LGISRDKIEDKNREKREVFFSLLQFILEVRRQLDSVVQNPGSEVSHPIET